MKTEKELLSLYPWLHPVNVVTNQKIEFSPNDKLWTELFSLPIGWRIAFQEELVSELDAILKESHIKDYIIFSIKQSSGKLEWKDNFKSSQNIKKELKQRYDALLNKYIQLGSQTCIFCGKKSIDNANSIHPVCTECHLERNHGYEKKKKK
jgi:hypothetical protein